MVNYSFHTTAYEWFHLENNYSSLGLVSFSPVMSYELLKQSNRVCINRDLWDMIKITTAHAVTMLLHK